MTYSNATGLLVHKALLNVGLVSTTEDHRYTLGGVHIRPDGTVEATDGHIALMAKEKNPTDPGDFPTIDSRDPDGLLPADGLMIDVDGVKALQAATKGRQTIPVLGCALLGVEKGGGFRAYATDLSSATKVKADENGHFPNLDRIMPKGDPIATVTVDAEILKTLATVVLKMARDTGSGRVNSQRMITLEIFGPEQPIRVSHTNADGLELTGVMMPMRA